MRPPCTLCQTRTWPLAHMLSAEEGRARAVCTSCVGRLAAFLRGNDRRVLERLFHLPTELGGSALSPRSVEAESLRRYAELGLLDDALLEAADALWELPDREIRAHSLEVIFGLLKEGALPLLRAQLFPC